MRQTRQHVLSHGLSRPANRACGKPWDLRCRQRVSWQRTAFSSPFTLYPNSHFSIFSLRMHPAEDAKLARRIAKQVNASHVAGLADDVMVARAHRIAPSILAAYIMFPYLASGLDAILNSRTFTFSPQLPGAILTSNAVPRCELNDKGGNRIICKFPGGQVATPLGCVALFPPMLRPPFLKIDLLHLEAFCLAEFEFSMIHSLAARQQLLQITPCIDPYGIAM